MPLQSVLLTLLDPRGRCNRKGLVIAAALMLAVEGVLGLSMWLSGRSLGDPAILMVKAALLYTAVSVASQRLHDLGRSAWWIMGAAVALIAWAFVLALLALLSLPAEAMAPGGTGSIAVFLGVAVPMMGALLWLHFAPGEDVANRFGPVPNGWGFARSERVRAIARQVEAGGAA